MNTLLKEIGTSSISSRVEITPNATALFGSDLGEIVETIVSEE